MANTVILVVDDEPDNFDVIEALIEQQDYHLYYAPHGQAALDTLAVLTPGLILLDVMMPDIDGIEVCRRIKSNPQWSSIPIMMVTALDSKQDLARCLEAGADDFISKPVSALELRARVRSLLRIKDQHDQIQGLAQLQTQTISLLEKTLSELRGNLARSLSHELNTPLNGILGTLDLLKHDFRDMTVQEVEEILGWMSQSALRLEHLAQKFLIYLELELAATHDQPDLFSESNLECDLEMVGDLLQSLARQNDRTADLILELPDEQLPFAERYFNILVTELVENAFKFSKPGQPVTVALQPTSAAFILKIKDVGHGMTPDQLQRIEALVQFDRQDHEQQGVGLGLRIAQKIAELGHAQFQITSQVDQGTQVDITFPKLNPALSL